ncbi:FERM and PDZ domain-containing protein 1 isoform X1 [Pezoporus wallicus]|uniref:FERM and PDZ domain-containing protein 1 isoform X1 n=1 Tax=Pezoporus wallicus TaxID=35540 RepID=UPI00254B204E|nr:FERM and PDZ domain-containing protein 1 isoform X1 [Pezoporus wallicus]
MEDLEANLIQTSKACRIEQMVAKWLHRTRDGASRGSVSVTNSSSDGSSQPASRVKITVTVYKDLVLHHYGFEICPNLPLTIASVTAGSTAEGKLQPGDQVLLINSTVVDDLSVERAADIIREAGDELLLTVLRCTSGGPKSSFLTAEKRARLKTNPVKVRFAEEVLVNGHTQGNSLLCMPSVLKVYLENGQTKAFRFETSTTVKDIVLTLKEKLSIRSIAHFALALEEQYNVAKIHLLHEEEFIEQVVQKRESQDYRCLFRVCFVPKDPLDLLQEDPIAFEYLYLQSCSDVLQERFAVEMKCSVALRLAALHIQERIYACAQPQKVSLKYIERDWGIENFISPTLLRNMRGKDIKKAISYHLKQNQMLLDPRQKYSFSCKTKHVLTAVQVRLSYLQILGDLKMYNGKIFNATLMLQDRESYVALLVGAKYGVSQIINNKLNIITSLAEFANISRLELTEESEKVSTVKIYLQDLKLLTLLLESNSAKDLVCLIIGYYRLFVDANVSIFTWGEKKRQLHRVSAEEGYESRTCSDFEDSWEQDSSSDHCLDTPTAYSSAHPVCNEEELGELHSLEKDSTKPQSEGSDQYDMCDNATDSASEASDSANTESRGFKTSGSSDSMDALEEDELEMCSSFRPEFFHFYTPTVQEMSHSYKSFFPIHAAGGSIRAETGDYFCFLQVPHAEELGCENSPSEQRGEDTGTSVVETRLSEKNTMGYYNLCYSISPAGGVERSKISHSPQRSPWKDESSQEGAPCGAEVTAEASDPILEPPPGFGDTSSEEEFYDAADRLSPPDTLAGYNMTSQESTENCSCMLKQPRCYSLGESLMTRQTAKEKHRKEKEMTYAKSLKKRRSFLKTDYTSQVTFPLALPGPLQSCCSWPPTPALHAQLPSSPSSENIKNAELRVPAAARAQRNSASPNPSSGLVEMEPDTMETKSVTDSLISSISAVCLQGVAMHVDSGLQPTHAVYPPFLSLEEGVPLRAGTSCLHAVRSPAQGSSSMKTNNGLLSEESCMDTRGWLAQVAQEEKGEVMAAQQAGDTHPCPSQEVTCPANKRTLTAHGSSMGSPHEVDKDHDQELLLTAEREAACKEPVPALCEEGKANCDSCAENSSDSALLQAKSRPVINKEALQKANNKNHIGFPDATQLLTGCSSTSGVETHLSWLSCGLRTDLASPSPSQERVDIPLELLASEKTSGCLEADAVGKEIQTFPAGALLVKELLSSQELDGDPRKDAGNVALTQPQPIQTPLPREQPTEMGKDSPITPSVGLSISSGPVSFGFFEKKTDHGASKHSLLCFNHKEDEQSPSDPIMIRSLGFSTMKKTCPPQLGMDKCGCRLSYISCFHRSDDKGECETTIPMCNAFLGPLTTPPYSSCSLPGTPVSSYPVSIARDMAGWDPYVQALSKLKDQAQMSPADFSCFLAYTTELQEVVGKLSRTQATHLQGQCSEQGAESKGTLGLVSRDLLSSCQELLKTEQSLKELQGVLRVTFNHLVQLAVACFQVTHCQLCRQRQQKLGVALMDVVGTYQQLVQAVHQQICRQGCPDVGAKLLARQHTALTASMFCLLQQFRVPPLL